MLLGHRETEAGLGGGADGAGAAGGGLSLAHALAQRFGLGGSIEAARLEGALSLDDAQADYVAALLGVSSLEEAPGPPLPGGSSAAAANGLASGRAKQDPEADLAALKSQVQQASSPQPAVALCLSLLPWLDHLVTWLTIVPRCFTQHILLIAHYRKPLSLVRSIASATR
jgi:hypothetical protein